MQWTMNKTIFTQEHKSCHPEKNFFFDILSLANQLHHLKSTILEDFKPKKIYFLENKVSNLINEGVEHFWKNINLYNICIKNSNTAII